MSCVNVNPEAVLRFSIKTEMESVWLVADRSILRSVNRLFRWLYWNWCLKIQILFHQKHHAKR